MHGVSRVARSLVVLGLLAGVTVGCRQVAGIEEPVERQESAQGVCGGLGGVTGACSSCLEQACCEEASRCGAAPGCAPLVGCAAACAPADVACLDRCESTALQASSPASEALGACLRRACDATCVACGSVPLALRTGHGPLVPRDDPACRTCAADRCCDAGSACAADAGCLALLACHEGCYPDTTCHADCDRAHPTGDALYLQMEACLQSQCGVSCPNPSPRWECVSRFQWPAARRTSVAMGGQVVDLPNLTDPVAGAKVTAYTTQDVGLSKPLGVGQTDASGFVQVPGLPVGATILSAAVAGFNGVLALEAAGRLPSFFYVNKPIYDDNVDYLMPMLSEPTAQLLATLSEVTLDPERGLVLAFITDCQVQPASGVSYTLEHSIPGTEGIVQFYVSNYSPSRALVETDPLGVGGFVNVPPGPFTVVARERATGKELARMLAYSRKGAVAWLHLNPSSAGR